VKARSLSFVRSASLTAFAATLALGLGACERAPATEEGHRQAEVGDSAGANEKARKVVVAGARKPVDDKALALNVKAALMASAALNATTIEVNVKDGVVTLSGTTNTPMRRDLATYIALRVDGVTRVRNRIAIITSS